MKSITNYAKLTLVCVVLSYSTLFGQTVHDTVPNNHSIRFNQSGETDDGTEIRRDASNALMFRYSNNDLYFDALDNKTIQIRNSSNQAQIKFNPSANGFISTLGSIKMKSYLLFDSDGDFTGGNYFTIEDDPTNNYLRFGYGFNDHLIIQSDGNIGIGTNSADNNLHIKQAGGDATFKIENTGNGNASIIAFSRERSTGENLVGGAIGLVSNTTSVWSQLFLNARSAGAESGVDGSGSQQAFLTIGNGSSNDVAIGIGTTAPRHELDVNGKIRCKELKMEVSPWPDYVFFDTYNLRSLEETAEYIETNGHLPEVPSAEQVAEEGINVGEMNAILLKKIEELTLHLIEKDKTEKQLIERIENLEAKLK